MAAHSKVDPQRPPQPHTTYNVRVQNMQKALDSEACCSSQRLETIVIQTVRRNSCKRPEYFANNYDSELATLPTLHHHVIQDKSAVHIYIRRGASVSPIPMRPTSLT